MTSPQSSGKGGPGRLVREAEVTVGSPSSHPEGAGVDPSAPSPNWRDHAACFGMDPAIFFPSEDNPRGDLKAAQAVCARCPVREACLEDALETGERDGVRGGLSGRQLRMHDRRRRAIPLVAECGTDSGYRKHRRAGEDACLPCIEAHRLANRVGDQARKTNSGRLPVVHGEDGRGYGRGCRCATCTAAHTSAMAEYRKRQRTSA